MIISSRIAESEGVAIPIGMFAVTYKKHLPSIMVAIGACGGFAAQLAVWRTLIQPFNRNPGDFLVHAQTKSNESFILGESINHFLFVTRPDRLSFLSTAAGGLQDNHELPNISELAAHVMQTMGRETFGIPRYPGPGQYMEEPRAALNRTFGIVASYFLKDGHPPKNWPALLGLIARRIIDTHKHVLPPASAVKMLLESAVPMSKIDRGRVETSPESHQCACPPGRGLPYRIFAQPGRRTMSERVRTTLVGP
ncbi:hypothetical protein LMG31506_03243 [Cupriavidus yeoncheonensis]|uniref:Uncharacterized protein n=1 Tax=Cupriavidus yeoncheonensis TaxID=1462994 RepID=A0A916MYD0_9BURK|nr:hypothetical protein [Cupriavidus yeoncheonensis]CAG2145723.1 hypothetical protein LMG31506_03243 [Cupriavidus yeoncheonensis]